MRIITATNRDLLAEVKAKRFREDLYFRLNVFPILSPALRERPEDIPLLASHFVKQICSRLGRPPARLRKADVERMQSYSWPGNIRELQNIIERALITSKGPDLLIDMPVGQSDAVRPAEAGSPQVSGILTEEQLRALEKDNLNAALTACGGKIFGADGTAALLGIKPTTLASRLKRFGIAT